MHCKICKRNGSNDDSFLQRFTTGNMFTHHQKSVILDAAGLEGGPQVEHHHLNKSAPPIKLPLGPVSASALTTMHNAQQHVAVQVGTLFKSVCALVSNA